jgi:YD repeat-containing protein
MIAQLSTVRFQRPLKCNGVTPDGTLNYTCFPTGKVETIVSSNPHGVSATYAYDAQNRLNTVVDNRLSGNNTTTYAYDSASNVANDGASTYLYDPLGERKEKSVAGVATNFVLAGG